MLRRWFGRWSYQVLLASDGARALALASTAPPDGVLMDYNMPVRDGGEATTRLKAAPALRAIPILVLTANALAGHRGRALAAGAAAYESKPIDCARLRHKLAALLAPAAPSSCPEYQ
jgi:CheY-like chemotaxis protein